MLVQQNITRELPKFSTNSKSLVTDALVQDKVNTFDKRVSISQWAPPPFHLKRASGNFRVPVVFMLCSLALFVASWLVRVWLRLFFFHRCRLEVE